MCGLRYLMLLGGILCFGRLLSQTGNDITSQWEALLAVDDHEKNYRFPKFLQSAEEQLGDFPLISVEEHIPADWSFCFSSDSSLVVLSAILNYDDQVSRLVYFIRSDQPGYKKVQSFQLDLASVLPSFQKPELRMSREDQRLVLQMVIGATTVLKLPDVELKMLLGMLKQLRDDEQKKQLGQVIEQKLQAVMVGEAYFSDPLPGYPEISTLLSQDGKVKLSTWNMEFNDGKHAHFGILAVKTDNGIRIYPLLDQSASIRTPEQAALNPTKWYGCIYYDIIEAKYKRNVFYTLIGYNGHDAFSQIKVVDVLALSKGNNPNPRFGLPVFMADKRTRRRLIFEYSNRATMLLRYDAREKMIVMDNLAPTNPGYQNDFRYYGPDFSYNGWKFEKGKWVLSSDIDLRNPSPGRR